jgi:hypothetical protein
MTLTKVLLGAALIVILGAAFVYRMGRHDVRALADFAASYQQFDKTMSDQALNDLRVKSEMRISSLTKNDGSMMKVAREASDLAATEFSLMKRSQVVRNDREAADELNARLNAVQRERKAAYAHFQRLLAAPPNSH